ncbi:MAG TPA: phage baseplate assembly protein V [Gemmatimonadota bacterium]|jgi:phage baseplate assembly protein gpV
MSQRSGVVTAFVKEVDAEQGRLRVEYRGIEEGLLSPWAYIAAPLSGQGRGALFMPEPDDEVLVCYGDDDFGHPYVVGCLWNGEQTSPETEAHNRVIVTPGGHQLRFEDKENDTRIVLRSKGGHSLTLEDKADQAKVDLKSNGNRELLLDDSPTHGLLRITSGQHEILLDDLAADAKVEVRVGSAGLAKITIKAAPPSLNVQVGANSLDISAQGVTLTAAGTVTVNAGGAVSITSTGVANVTCTAANITAAGAMNLTTGVLSVTAGLATFAGVVMASAVITPAVVSPLYSPGVGNLI